MTQEIRLQKTYSFAFNPFSVKFCLANSRTSQMLSDLFITLIECSANFDVKIDGVAFKVSEFFPPFMLYRLMQVLLKRKFINLLPMLRQIDDCLTPM